MHPIPIRGPAPSKVAGCHQPSHDPDKVGVYLRHEFLCVVRAFASRTEFAFRQKEQAFTVVPTF